jgi:hypothetical protein
MDLVMAGGPGALDFTLKYGPERWPRTPIVFYSNVGDKLTAGWKPFPDVTGLLIDLDPRASSTSALVPILVSPSGRSRCTVRT